ncbi:MAG TPA: hypothetical protein VNM90_15690 [Haliangium sp.]|nr:hypothetical protein [Haliangium sp.]
MARLQVDFLRTRLKDKAGKDALAQSNMSQRQGKHFLDALYREMCKRAERSVR